MLSLTDAKSDIVERVLSEINRKQTTADIQASLAQGRVIVSSPTFSVLPFNSEVALLTDAKSALSEWCANKSAALAKGHGFKVRSGLVRQIQREVMTEAHRLSEQNKLSEQQEAELVIHGIANVQVPEFRVR